MAPLCPLVLKARNMKTNSKISEEAVPSPGGWDFRSEVWGRAGGQGVKTLAQGRAWCLDFISKISIECLCEVEKTTPLTLPGPWWSRKAAPANLCGCPALRNGRIPLSFTPALPGPIPLCVPLQHRRLLVQMLQE